MKKERVEILCVSSQKTLVLGDRERAQKEQAEKLKDFVRTLGLSGGCVELPGGCLVAQNALICEEYGVGAVFTGRIENKEALLEKLHAEKSDDNNLRLQEDLRFSDAQLVCALYTVYGRILPQKLKGDFSFVLFDPTQGRVLAARSPSSPVPLLQTRSSDNSLIVTTLPVLELPAGTHSAIPIPAGYLKYGWSSDPQRYASFREREAKGQAFAAAKRALKGIVPVTDSASSSTAVQLSGNSFGGSESGGEPQSPAPKKTRRGKRAGRNQKSRAEQMLLQRQSCDGGHRPSLDHAVAGSLQSASSFSSRADEHTWWRTNTPRGSLDISGFSGRHSERASMESRRASMSPAAPPFVPGHFTRQSVPALKTQSSALSFGPVPACITGSRTVLRHDQVAPSGDVQPRVSAFEDQPKKVYKADAAWEEEGGSARSATIAECSAESAEERKNMGSETAATSSCTPAIHLEQRTIIAKPAGQPPRARSVNKPPAVRGSSPDRPLLPLTSAPLRQLFKAMLTKRPSQLSLGSEGEAAGGSSRARSSSHGNLVDLEHPTGLWDAPRTDVGSESCSCRADDHSGSLSRDGSSGDMHALALQKMHLGGMQREGQRNAASWLAKKTRSIFSKSKSCTNLAEMEKPVELRHPPVGDVRVA